MPAGNPMGYVRDIGSRNRRSARRDRRRGREAEDEFLDRSLAYDPEEAARTAGRASFEEFEEDFGENVRDLRGSQVERGRVGSRSGFGFEDEDELFDDSLEGLERVLAQNAISSSRLDLQNIGNIGAHGERVTQRGHDLAASERDAGLAEEELRRRDRANRRAGLFGTLGRVGGTLLGPAGAAVGEDLGTRIEELLS